MTGAEEATSAVTGLRGPFAVKVVSSDIPPQERRRRCRALGLVDSADVADAIRDMARKTAIAAAAAVDGFLVEEMAPAGLEVVVGAVREGKS